MKKAVRNLRITAFCFFLSMSTGPFVMAQDASHHETAMEEDSGDWGLLGLLGLIGLLGLKTKKHPSGPIVVERPGNPDVSA